MSLNRRQASAALIGAAAAASGLARADEPARPNILVFIADDAGAAHFGLYGNKIIETPVIDALGAGGFIGDNAILTTPQCSPSRISILTGKHPHATGAEDLHVPMPAEHKIVPHYLQQAGYFTGHMRKTHYGPHADQQFNWYAPEFDALPEFLDATGEAPWFLWVGFNDPHRPYNNGPIKKRHDPEAIDVPPWLVDTPATRRDLADYYDEIARMDEVIGLMLREIARRGQRDNTLVVVISDNGSPFPREKGTLYDAGVKTPFVVNWPARIPAGIRHSRVMSVIDLAPTFLAAAGVAKPGDMQGENILAGLQNPALLTRDAAFSQRNWHNCDEHMRSIRTERYKLVSNAYLDLPHGTASDIGKSPAFKDLLAAKNAGTLTQAQSLLFEVPRPAFELYDLAADPQELSNVAGDPAYASVLTDLQTRLQAWRDETGDFPPWKRRRADNVDRQTGEKVWSDYRGTPLQDE